MRDKNRWGVSHILPLIAANQPTKHVDNLLLKSSSYEKNYNHEPKNAFARNLSPFSSFYVAISIWTQYRWLLRSSSDAYWSVFCVPKMASVLQFQVALTTKFRKSIFHLETKCGVEQIYPDHPLRNITVIPRYNTLLCDNSDLVVTIF